MYSIESLNIYNNTLQQTPTSRSKCSLVELIDLLSEATNPQVYNRIEV